MNEIIQNNPIISFAVQFLRERQAAIEKAFATRFMTQQETKELLDEYAENEIALQDNE